MQRYQERPSDARIQEILAENRRFSQQRQQMQIGAVQILSELIQEPVQQEIGQGHIQEQVQGGEQDNQRGQSWFRGILNRVRQTFSVLGQNFRNAWTRFTNVIQQIFTLENWASFGRRILGAIIGFIIWLANFFKQRVRAVINGLIAGCRWIASIVIKCGSYILSKFQNIWKAVRGYFNR